MGSDPDVYFRWLDAVERYGPYDEDAVVLPLGLGDPYAKRRPSLRDLAGRLAARLRR